MSTFNYFGYASNLAAYKVGLRCKSSKKYGLGKVSDRTIDFAGYSEDWKGGTATMVEKQYSELWGVIWKIAIEEMPLLDEQEGVSHGNYRARTIEVKDSNGKLVKCRVYEQVDQGQQRICPSPQYLAVILEGAKANRLPPEYIAMLENVATNNNTSTTDLMTEINKRRQELSCAQ